MVHLNWDYVHGRCSKLESAEAQMIARRFRGVVTPEIEVDDILNIQLVINKAHMERTLFTTYA